MASRDLPGVMRGSAVLGWMRWSPILAVLALATAPAVVDARPPLDDVDDTDVLCGCLGDPAFAVGTAMAYEDSILGLTDDPCTGEVAVVVEFVEFDAVRFEYAGPGCLVNAFWYFECETNAEADLHCSDATGWLTVYGDGRIESVAPAYGHRLVGQLTRLA